MQSYSSFHCFLLAVLRLTAALFAVLPPLLVHAQEETGEVAELVREAGAVKDKTVIFVFDVSGSMRGDDLRRVRETTIGVLREGTGTGDRVVLFTFGTDTKKVFDKTLESPADKTELIQQVPSQPQEGAGTNIRRPHHEALKILEQTQPRPGFVILLTDSFNDEPKPADPAYPDYLRYYTPGGQLTKYPDTPENRDYERLLRKLYVPEKIKAFGVGVQIDPGGRPIERLPKAAPSAQSLPATPLASAPEREEKPASALPWILLGVAAVLVAVAALVVAPLLKAASFRISGGQSGAKDFSLKSGQVVRIGGKGASFAGDAYPLPGIEETVAEIRGGRGGLRLVPTAAVFGGKAATVPAPAPGGGTPQTGPRVFHNGLLLEKEEPLAFGDELRVSAPDPSSGGVAREFRLKLEDPRKTF
ncbi:MAG: VWA domain-containing protein [Cytophagales bacterium]|nr:VWA domain-containing protein [Armatimonadota bacterium]